MFLQKLKLFLFKEYWEFFAYTSNIYAPPIMSIHINFQPVVSLTSSAATRLHKNRA